MLFFLRTFSNFYKYKRKVYEKFKIAVENYSSNTNHLKLVFFGTDKFSLPSLQALYNESKLPKSKISSVQVVTSFKAVSNPVRSFAKNNGLELFKWPIEPDSIGGSDLGIVVSFGHLIPNKIISVFPFGMINVHASLLPRWRGAAPIIYAIMNNDKISGVTIMKIEPHHFDVGEILAQKEVPIKPNILLPELHDKLATEGAQLLLDVVRKIPKCLENSLKQDTNLVTYAPKITNDLLQINWKELTAKEIYDRYRALYSFHQLNTTWQDYGVKLMEINFSNDQINEENQTQHKKIQNPSPSPGFVEFSKNGKCLKVLCNDGCYVNISKIKIEGKKVMSAVDFNNGFLKKCPKDQRYFK